MSINKRLVLYLHVLLSELKIFLRFLGFAILWVKYNCKITFTYFLLIPSKCKATLR